MERSAAVSGNSKGALAAVILVSLEAALVITWSAGFIGMRFAIDHAPVILVLLWRNLLSGVVLLPFALFAGPRPGAREILPHVLFGVLTMFLYLGAFSLAIAYGVPTGLVALMADMLPIAVALLSWPVLGQGLTARQWLGSVIGITGVIVASGWSHGVADVPAWAYGLPVFGTLAIAVATLLQKRGGANALPVHQSLCIQCLSAAALFSVFAWNQGGVAPVADAGFIGGILWLTFVATIAAGSLYYLALRRSSPARVTAVLYLSPPVTTVWAWLVFDEPLSRAMAVGLVISLAGIAIFAGPTGAPGPLRSGQVGNGTRPAGGSREAPSRDLPAVPDR